MAKKTKALADSKRKKFLYDMVIAEIFPYRTVEKDSNLIGMSSNIREKAGFNDGRIPDDYAELVVYTMALTFDWSLHPDAPSEMQQIELWWQMVDDGELEEECYAYFRKHVGWDTIREYQSALRAAHETWKPVEEHDDRDNEDADPNS